MTMTTGRGCRWIKCKGAGAGYVPFCCKKVRETKSVRQTAPVACWFCMPCGNIIEKSGAQEACVCRNRNWRRIWITICRNDWCMNFRNLPGNMPLKGLFYLDLGPGNQHDLSWELHCETQKLLRMWSRGAGDFLRLLKHQYLLGHFFHDRQPAERFEDWEDGCHSTDNVC